MTGKDLPSTHVLLLRGINVNPATRVTMSELRALVSDAGYSNVRTLLQSGNVILESASAPDVPALESAILARTGVRSQVVSLPLRDFQAIADANPLLEVSDDLSRIVVTFLDGDLIPAEVERPSDAELAPERLVIARRAIYQFCPDGILKSRLKAAWWRQFGPVATTRNVRTVNRIIEAAAGATTRD